MIRNLSINVGNTADASWIAGLERAPGEGNGNPFQYSCLENPMDRGAWQAMIHGVAKSPDMTGGLTKKKNNNLISCPDGWYPSDGLNSLSLSD